MAIKYDENGRRHYIFKDIPRSASREPYENNGCSRSDQENYENSSNGRSHSRKNSTGNLKMFLQMKCTSKFLTFHPEIHLIKF